MVIGSQRYMTHRGLGPATLLLAVALLCGGCNAYAYREAPLYAHISAGELFSDHALLHVTYATDRNVSGASEPYQFFANSRTDHLKFGMCEVSIPRGHGVGRLEEPAWPWPERLAEHVTLQRVDPPESRDVAMADLRRRVQQSPRHELFLFVHGFYTTFAEASRRAAQITHDIQFDGPTVIYSWPATSFLAGYLIDESTCEWTTRYMREFLEALCRESGAEHIHIMAHSMGARIVCRAMTDICGAWPSDFESHIDQVVLAAADIDAELFARDYAPALARMSRRVTVYVSGADWALGGSQRLHYYKRLGQPGSLHENDSWRQRIDIVDVTAHDKGVVGHIYYGASPRVLSDLRGIIAGKAPRERELLHENGSWRMPP